MSKKHRKTACLCAVLHRKQLNRWNTKAILNGIVILPSVSPLRPPASSVVPPVKAPSSGAAVPESGVSLETSQLDSSRWPQMPDQKLAYSATSPPYLWSNDDEDGFVMHDLKPKYSGSKAFNHCLFGCWSSYLQTDRRCWDAAGNTNRSRGETTPTSPSASQSRLQEKERNLVWIH